MALMMLANVMTSSVDAAGADQVRVFSIHTNGARQAVAARQERAMTARASDIQVAAQCLRKEQQLAELGEWIVDIRQGPSRSRISRQAASFDLLSNIIIE